MAAENSPLVSKTSSSSNLDLESETEFIVNNGYDELLFSLRSEENTSFSNVHLKSKVGILRVSLGALLIGTLFGLHVGLFFMSIVMGKWWLLQWCLYVFVLLTFHYLEFLTTAAFKPRDVSFESYLLFHSVPYVIAASASWVEFWIELWLFPGLKGRIVVFLFGLLAAVAFQTVRSSAMITAGRNFNHLVQYEVRHSYCCDKIVKVIGDSIFITFRRNGMDMS